MKLLVTGRTGQLARSLAERALNHPQVELNAFGRPELELQQPGSAADLVARIQPDVVINAAAYTAVDQAEEEPERASRVNGIAVGELAAGCRAIGARLIQISTDYVFDGSKNGPYSEADATRPIGVYGRSKLLGEEEARSGTPDHLIVRTAWVFSPFGRNFVRTVVGAAVQRNVLTVVEDQHGNPTSALDLADALLTILSKWSQGDRTGLAETYHVAGTGEASWCGFAEKIMDGCRRVGLPAAEVKPIRTEDWPTRAVRPANSTLNCSKFARDFGFVMPAWRASLSNVVQRLAGGER